VITFFANVLSCIHPNLNNFIQSIIFYILISFFKSLFYFILQRLLLIFLGPTFLLNVEFSNTDDLSLRILVSRLHFSTGLNVGEQNLSLIS
jgi:hypothetical protein